VTDHIEFEQWVPFSVAEVFLFFANPKNLPRIMPAETDTKLVSMKLVAPLARGPGHAAASNADPLAGVGSEIVTSFRVLPFLPIRAEWIAVITEFEGNHHFADTQKKGPFKSFHHRHELIAETRDSKDGTIIRDQIDYEVGFGPLGKLAQKVFVRSQLRRTFAYRQQAVEKLLSAPRP
jgi:ligand-binding SRPBCC domain-containing protein